MAKFTYSSSLTFRLPKVKVDKDALKKDRLAMKKKLVKSHVQGMQFFEHSLSGWLDAAILSPSWAWPRGGPRDIFESGRLMRSKKITTKHMQTKSVTSVLYTSPYAALMYYGGMIQPYGNKSAASILIPGRPWVEAALNGTYGMTKPDLAAPYNAGFKAAWG